MFTSREEKGIRGGGGRITLGAQRGMKGEAQTCPPLNVTRLFIALMLVVCLLVEIEL